MINTKVAFPIRADGMISHITFGVMNGESGSECSELLHFVWLLTEDVVAPSQAAKMPANYVWLNLHTFQHQGKRVPRS